MIHRALRLVLVATALLLVAAPAAVAVQTTVRAEATGFTAVPATSVDETSAGGTYTDTAGHSGTTTKATAFGATALATNAAGTTWDFTWGSMGAFVNAFAGQTSDTSWANWWQFNVNGYSAPVGPSSLDSVAGDSYLWFQNPDPSFSRGGYALVLTPGATALAPGDALTVTVKGDDLSKVDNQADATRFGITDPSLIQTPSEFPTIDGATIHVGSQAYAASGSELTIDDLPNGTWWVWADKTMDASYVYARSERFQVNVGDAPKISKVSVKPAKYTRNRALTIRFTASKKMAKVTYTIKSARGKILGRATVTGLGSGRQAVVWAGTGASSRQLGKKLTVSLKGTDEWGRVSNTAMSTVRVRSGSGNSATSSPGAPVQ